MICSVLSQPDTPAEIASDDPLRALAERQIALLGELAELDLDVARVLAADRRVVHQLAAEYGLASDSAGDGRDPHIVLKKTDD